MRPLSRMALLAVLLPQTASAFSLVAVNHDWAETEEYCNVFAGCSSIEGTSNDTSAGAFDLDTVVTGNSFDSVADSGGVGPLAFASDVVTLSHGTDEVLSAISSYPQYGLTHQYHHAETDSTGMKIDRDWYSFTPVGNACLEVCLHKHAPTLNRTVQPDWELALYDSAMDEVDRIAGPGCTNVVATAGRHYIEVSDPTPEYVDIGVGNSSDIIIGFAHQYYRFEYTSGGASTTWFADTDGDGYGSGSGVGFCGFPGAGWVDNDGDCNDSDAAVNPDASEVCDGTDTDCNGTADDGLPTDDWYADDDGDGFGAEGATAEAFCADPGAGYAPDATDCDDDAADTNPEAVELCDGADNDCDTMIDDNVTDLAWYVDSDGDGEGDSAEAPVFDCADPGAGYADNADDCDDDDADVYSAATELCNGADDDCDGEIDEDLTFETWYADADGDGAGDPGTGVELCADPGDGSVTSGDDCDDSDDEVSPTATEVCDGIDRDCNGTVDDAEGCVEPVGEWQEGTCTCGNGQPTSGWLFLLAVPLALRRRTAPEPQREGGAT